MEMLHALRGIWSYGRIFSTLDAAITYRKLRKGGRVSKVLAIRPLQGHSLHCRPCTSDAEVLWDTFHHKNHLPPRDLSPKTILDLGSNIGLTVAHYAAVYPAARILGIELDKNNYELAVKNIDPWKDRCRVIHGAVWTEAGEISYGGDSEWGFRIDSSGKERVRTLTMNAFLDEMGSCVIDFVKMDVEGAEASLLPKAGDWSHRVRTLKVEVHHPYTVERCISDLTSAGFTCTEDPVRPACVYAVRKDEDRFS